MADDDASLEQARDNLFGVAVGPERDEAGLVRGCHDVDAFGECVVAARRRLADVCEPPVGREADSLLEALQGRDRDPAGVEALRSRARNVPSTRLERLLREVARPRDAEGVDPRLNEIVFAPLDYALVARR